MWRREYSPMKSRVDYFIALKARQFQAAMKFGKPYTTDRERGFIYRGRAWATEMWTLPQRGEHYKGTCDCSTPPWEECEHSFKT